MWIVLLFVILLFLSGLFSATEIAFFSLRPARIQLMLDQQLPGARKVQQLLKNSEYLLITILIGNNIINTFTASLATVVTTEMVGSAGLGIATGVVTFLILMFGEITPKAFAQNNNEWLARKIATPISWLLILFMPIVWLLRSLTRGMLFPFRSKISTTQRKISKEELRTLSRLAHEEGAVDIYEHNLVESALQFSDHQIKDVFLPLHKVISLNGETPIDQIAHFAAQVGHSRYPVFEGEKDDIIGYIHANDILRLLNSDDRDDELLNYVRPIMKIDLADPIERVFRAMQRRREHIALVVGTKKQPLGIVTLEDMLEELVGEIEDEIDEQG